MQKRAGLQARQIKSIALILAGFLLSLLVVAPLQATDTPTLRTPENGTTPTITNERPLGIPEFSWAPVAGATSYRLQICPDIACATTVVNITTPNTRYTPTSVSALADGTWYWHIRVETPAPIGDYSSIWSFTKQWASPDNAPTLTAPTEGATLDFYDQDFYNQLIFTWQPVTGAASYCLQIATSDTGFSSSCSTTTTQKVAEATLATTFQPEAKLANGTYYWRVIPLDPANHNGTISEVRSFTASYLQAPTLLSPANNAFPTFTPTFNWTAITGTQFSRLQYSTDPSFSSGVTQVDTRNTSYTPVDALPNDVNYYWRVRVHSGNSISDWSETRTFRKQWYIQPVLLTPTDGYPYVKDPFFSWSPVEGASYYKIEFNSANSFLSCTLPCWSDTTVNPFFAVPAPGGLSTSKWDWPLYSIWYWRVTPIDANGNSGKPSLAASFGYNPTALAPNLINPLYYYSPTTSLQPHEDRTVPLPVFMWHRTLSYTYGYSGFELPTYRVQVDDTPLFLSPDWTADTENMSAVPTTANPFTPTVGGIYYWRVRPLTALTGTETAQWSQIWKTRIDTTQTLTPTNVITLLRPASGFEAVEMAPLLEWWPLQGADSYEMEISADSAFSLTPTLTATVPYPAFTPQTRLGYGTYYWHVRGRSGGSPLGNWSATWRFQVAAQSHWRQSRTLGNNQLLIGSDPAGDMTDPNYDLTNLYAAQDKDFWYFGFNVMTTTADMTYTLYLDLDHVDNSGATFDARGFNVNTILAHRPEYALYIEQTGGTFDASKVYIYGWTGDNWAFPQTLNNVVGGALTATTNYVELKVPNTIIGMQDTTNSTAVSLFNGLASGGHAQDTVPSDPNVAYTISDTTPITTTLSRFTSVSERLNLAMPPSNATGDPTLFPSVLPFFYHFPADTAWYGYEFEAAVDQQFTSVIWDYWIYATSALASPLIPPAHTYNDGDFIGDNTYYWHVRPVYTTTATIRGAWSLPGRFERQGFVPQNLTTTVTFATPTFTWDVVEGARSYDIQVDDDPSFGSTAVNDNTARNSYTPITTLANGTYYWRVRVRRYGGSSSSSQDIINDWSPSQILTLTLPQPTGLTHNPSGVVPRAPTLCWDHLILSSTVSASLQPVLAAYKYRVQVSKDQAFSSTFDTIDTEQACWTPAKGYDDGTYYWRAAMMDGNSTARLGSYTSAITFTKQYPVSTLVSPTSGGVSAETPTFVWTPVNGADSYRLEVSKSPTFSPLYDGPITTNNTRYTPTKTYTPESTYYWRVAIVDDDGNIGPFNNATLILDPYPYHLYLPLIRK